MKAFNIKAATVLLALLIHFSAFSSGGTDQLNKAVQDEIRSQLNIRVAKNEKVEVLFTTAANGKVDVVIAKTENKDLQKTVESGFSRLRFDNIKPGDCYSVTLNLKLI